MNHRTMFEKYPMGFTEYRQWSEYAHNMWDKHDLGCEHFGEEWLQLWDALGRVLELPVRIEYLDEFGDDGWYPARTARPTLARALVWCVDEWERHQNRVRIVIVGGDLNRTVVKEWGGK
jgi:RNAse (barnase) inhibitor barstar